MIRSKSARIGLMIMALGVMMFSSLSFANVSLRNGNFFSGYTDMLLGDAKLERVYNAKSPFHGIFGWGWGTEWEAFLTVSADASIVVHEHGGGAENRFTPTAFSAAELSKAVDAIVAVAQKAGLAGTAAQLAAYKNRLKTDATFRNDEWEKFRAQGKIQPRQLPVGTQLHSNRFSYQYLTKTAAGYARTFDTGKLEKFDENGRLIGISDKNGNFIELTYGKDGHLQKVVDNANRKMFFTFNSQGLVEKVEGENNQKAEYKYNNLGELIWSRDVDGNTYGFKYDNQNRHNLVQIDYSDKTSMVITYYGRDKHENVKSVKDRDGTLTEYDYITDPADPSHFTATVKVKSAEGKELSKSQYEYLIKKKADGEEWTYKMITVLDGDRTETTYNECCGLPLVIKHGKDETSFEYDAKGHVTKKSTPTEITQLHYDPKAGKVDRVSKYSKSNPKVVMWSEFKYDSKANLEFAKNSEGKGVKLMYDPRGRIRILVDQNRHQISFKYNENSKPIEIADPSLGTITVSYANSGEIKKVESSAGRKIAIQVTSSFQNLLDIIRPAGVTLAF